MAPGAWRARLIASRIDSLPNASQGVDMKTLALLALLTLAAASVASFAADPACSTTEHRQFDFWIGEWQVRTPDGKVAGRNHITREYTGCVIHEHYSTDRGYSGESL